MSSACCPISAWRRSAGFFSKDFEKRGAARRWPALTDWVECPCARRQVEVHPHVLHGKIYDEILRAADKLGWM
jgi:hypothetical protein